MQQISLGVGVGRQLTVVQLADHWSEDVADIVPLLHVLRELGYEVRNQSTNPQITAGEYLIPYLFPTLTPRSVQLRKRL